MRTGMFFLIGVEVPARRHAVRTAAVTELVDVEAVLAGGQSHDFPGDLDLVAFLREDHDAMNLAVAQVMNDADGLGRSRHLRLRGVLGAQEQGRDQYSKGDGTQ